MLGNAHMRSTPSLRRFPNVAFEKVPMFVWLTMALSRPSKEASFQPLSPPGDRWRDILGFVPTGCVSSSLALQIFREASHLWVLLCPPVYLLSFPFIPACPGQHTHSFRRWMSTTDTFQSVLPVPLSTFCIKLIESVRMMAYVVRLSPPEAVQRRAASTSVVKLEAETYRIFMDGSRILLDSEAPTWLVFGDFGLLISWQN